MFAYCIYKLTFNIMNVMLDRLSAFFMDILQVVVFAVAIFLVVYLLILQPHKIKGHSMDPNFEDGEFLLTDKVSYRFGNPERGDVVVLKAPPTYEEEFIKRIIGLPGDRVMVKDNHIYVNGKLIDETAYLNPSVRTEAGIYTVEGKEVIIPDNNYLAIGDNREHSYDGRNFGTISRDKITGKAWLSYWPLSRLGFIKKTTYSFKS